MPVYEYEHVFDECELCDFRFAVIQSVDEPSLSFCPNCGLEVRRVISKASILKGAQFSASKAAKAGFTTWRKSGDATWEKVDGTGVDVIRGTADEIAAVQAEKAQRSALDLDD